ncbi:MAG: SGNH/GDSL hydrolase family protein [Desulfobaccales bacterium]
MSQTGKVKPRGLVAVAGVAVIFLVIFATLELAAFLYTSYLAKKYGILFYLPNITEDYPTYAARLNPLLGWPSPQALEQEAQAAPGKAAISAYGDSFTAGYGVEPEYAWSNVLGRMLSRQIANYGVPGYGTDQAYLRFHDNAKDTANLVFLGLLSENVQRNVNQLRNFIIPNSQCQTKPRFLLDDKGALQLAPLPDLTAENYRDFIESPERFLEHDYFRPGGPSGAQHLGFPYTWSILKAHRFFYNRYVLGYTSYLQFYQPGHPSRALPLTMAIVQQFHREAKDRGKHPIVLIFPGPEDFPYYQQHKKPLYEPLLQEFQRRGIEYVDLGVEIIKRLGSRDYSEIFLAGRYSHFNEKGNRLVAEIIYDYLKSKDYVPQSPRQDESRGVTPAEK